MTHTHFPSRESISSSVNNSHFAWWFILVCFSLEGNIANVNGLFWWTSLFEYYLFGFKLVFQTFSWTLSNLISRSDWLTTKRISVLQMRKHGFGHFMGVDGSEAMLELAKETGLYKELKQLMLGHLPLPVQWGNLMFDHFILVIYHWACVHGLQ